MRAWRKGGLAALKPAERADTGTVRAHPELFAQAAALRLELPGRSAAQIDVRQSGSGPDRESDAIAGLGLAGCYLLLFWRASV
jgi:hypothetical protein